MVKKRLDFSVKIATPDMLDELHAVEVAAWGPELAASRELIEKRITRFPLGNFAAVDSHSRIIGYVCSVAIDPIEVTTWKSATGDGEYLTCNPYGEMGFGVNVSVLEEFADHGIGNALIEHVVQLAFMCGRTYFRFGSRMLEYREWQHVLSPDDYGRALVNDGRVFFRNPASNALVGGMKQEELLAKGEKTEPASWPQWTGIMPEPLEPLDKGVRFFSRVTVDGHRPRIFQVQENYFTDPDSLNYGVVMGWDRSDIG
jgi:GNAT superfamily N-acetyltransferase